MDIIQHEVKRYAKLNEMERKRELEKKRRKRKINAKLNFFKALCMLMIIGLLGRIAYIKVVKGEEYEREAIENQANRLQQKTINPNRGNIVDRNKQNLAISNIVYRVILDVRLIDGEDKKDLEKIEKGDSERQLTSEKTFKELNAIMGIELDELRSYISKNEEGVLKYDTNYLDIGIVPHAKAMEIKNNKNIKCVFLFEESERNYIYDTLAPQVIGFTRGEYQWGIEKVYDSQLKGIEGRVYAYGSDNGMEQNSIDPVTGNTVVTTLDFHIQQFAQEACDKAFAQYEAQNTSVIVMDPITGEVLAMAQSPTFSLNDPWNIEYVNNELLKSNWDGMGTKAQSDALSDIWSNYNVTSTFEPGSIFKPIVVAAALEENIISYQTPATYYCGGYKTFEGHDKPISCHVKYGHGNLTLEQVISNSCNVAMMDIGAWLGRDLFYRYQRDFGYGEKTGIDLPVESNAYSLIYPLSGLNPVELATSSFGQGFNCTPIQAINSFAALINGGNIMKPYIVSQIVDVNGNVVYENEPTVVRKVISRETSDYLRNAMVQVVSEGTGKRAAIPGYNIGGKTGTAEQGVRNDENYTVSFIAYLPAENPEILAMAIIDKPAEYIEGSTSVAPMLKDVLLDIIKYRGLQPSDSEMDMSSLNIGPDNKTLGDYKGMSLKDAISALNGLGVDFEIIGPGGSAVTNQIPPAGSSVDSTSVVYLNAAPGEGEALISIPDLAGLTYEQAVFVIENSGLVPYVYGMAQVMESIAPPPDTGQGEGGGESEPPASVVVGQMPAGGAKVPPGTQIKILVE